MLKKYRRTLLFGTLIPLRRRRPVVLKNEALKLKNAIKEANAWLEAGEGISLLYHWDPGHCEPELRSVLEKVLTI